MYRIDPDGKHKTIRLTYKLGTGTNEYWGVQMTDWEDAPVLSERNFIRSIGGRTYELHYSGPKLHMVVLRQGGATLLGREHAARLALERDDARDRQGSQAARQDQVVGSAPCPRSLSSGPATSASSPARASPSSATTSSSATSSPSGSSCSAPARCRSTSRASTSCCERNAERLTYTLDVGEAIADADFLYVAVGTPPTYSGDADLSAVWTVVDELARPRPARRRRDEEHRARSAPARRCVTASTSAGSSTSATPRTRSSPPRARPSATSSSPTGS